MTIIYVSILYIADNAKSKLQILLQACRQCIYASAGPVEIVVWRLTWHAEQLISCTVGRGTTLMAPHSPTAPHGYPGGQTG